MVLSGEKGFGFHKHMTEIQPIEVVTVTVTHPVVLVHGPIPAKWGIVNCGGISSPLVFLISDIELG